MVVVKGGGKPPTPCKRGDNFSERGNVRENMSGGICTDVRIPGAVAKIGTLLTDVRTRLMCFSLLLNVEYI